MKRAVKKVEIRMKRANGDVEKSSGNRSGVELEEKAWRGADAARGNGTKTKEEGREGGQKEKKWRQARERAGHIGLQGGSVGISR
jgi:hypothetical protein